MSVGGRSDIHIVIGRQDLQFVQNFPDLGCFISREGEVHVDVRMRLLTWYHEWREWCGETSAVMTHLLSFRSQRWK